MAAYAVFLERSFFGDFHDILRARPGLKGLLLHLSGPAWLPSGEMTGRIQRKEVSYPYDLPDYLV
jgi:hypothetical protein